MARKKKETKQEVEKPKVRCSGCMHFVRDTSGPSFDISTGEFFMGVCSKGLHPDSPIKQFADMARHCKKYRTKIR